MSARFSLYCPLNSPKRVGVGALLLSIPGHRLPSPSSADVSRVVAALRLFLGCCVLEVPPHGLHLDFLLLLLLVLGGFFGGVLERVAHEVPLLVRRKGFGGWGAKLRLPARAACFGNASTPRVFRRRNALMALGLTGRRIACRVHPACGLEDRPRCIHRHLTIS